MPNAKVVEIVVTEILEGKLSIGSVIAHFNELVMLKPATKLQA